LTLLLLQRRRVAGALGLALGLCQLAACSPSEHPPVNLQVAVSGDGSVSSSLGGIQCGAQCQTALPPATQVQLTALPASGQRFVQWDGRCQGTVPQCTLTLYDDSQTSATFAPILGTCFDGTKNGSETAVDCGGSCGPCDEGQSCLAMADCKSGQCLKGRCSLCPIGQELVVNGGAEAGASAPSASVPAFLPGWATSFGMTVLAYGTPGYPQPSDPGPVMRGNNFFMGGQAALSLATQGVDLRACSALIEQGAVGYTLSAYLGGLANQDDSAVLVSDFQNDQGASQTQAVLGPVTAADRNNLTGLVGRMGTGTVPVGTQRIILTVTATRVQAPDNDGYADNISLMLSLN
jgi:hypothetical protein